MIGGQDIVIPAAGLPASLDACACVVRATMAKRPVRECGNGRKDPPAYGDIFPLGKIRHLLAYPSAEAEAKWDQDSDDSPINSMILLDLPLDDSVTAVVDDPHAGEMPGDTGRNQDDVGDGDRQILAPWLRGGSMSQSPAEILEILLRKMGWAGWSICPSPRTTI